jgi:hypothetical protein
MNTSYWLKIALRAFGIFLVGMVFVGAGRWVKGAKDQVRTWGHELEHGSSSVALSLPSSVVPMYVSGIKVGKLDTVVVLRHAPNSIDGLRVVANLDDNVDVDRFRQCSLRLQSVDEFDFEDALECAEDTSDLLPFGTVVYRGTDVESALFLSPEDVHHLPWRYHSHGPDWDFDIDIPQIDIDLGDINIDIGDVDIGFDLENLAGDLQDLAEELEDLGIEIDGSHIRIEELEGLDERIRAHIERSRERLEERQEKLQRIRREVRENH